MFKKWTNKLNWRIQWELSVMNHEDLLFSDFIKTAQEFVFFEY